MRIPPLEELVRDHVGGGRTRFSWSRGASGTHPEAVSGTRYVGIGTQGQ